MKVLLLTINNREYLGTKDLLFIDPPLNLMYLAQSLINAGHDSKIIDACALNLPDAEIIKKIKAYKPDIIGISLYSWDLDITFRITKKIKKSFPKIKMLFGGHHATYVPDKVMKEFYFVDYILRGEGEKTIVELVDAINTKSPLSGVKGITYRVGRKVIHNADNDIVHNLDEIPIPNPNLIDPKLYYSKLFKKNPMGVIITSRGCPYRCTFCSRLTEDFRKYRQRSVENVIEEMKLIYASGAKSLDIYDETFTINKERCKEIFKRMKEEGLKFDIRIRTRVNVVNKEMLEYFYENNVKIVCYGVESGNSEILKNINKMITLPQIEKAFKMTHKIGLETSAFYIVGLPGDTPETIMDTINFAKKLEATYPSFGHLIPYPKTQVYDEASKWGELVGEWGVYTSEPYLKLPWMKSKDDMQVYLKKAFDDVIKNPRFVIKALIRCIKTRNWNNFSYMARNAFKDLRKIKGFRVEDKLRLSNE